MRKEGRKECFLAQSGNLGPCLGLPSCRNRATLPMTSPVPPATRLWVSCLWLQLPGACSGLGCPARLAPGGLALLTLDSFLDCPAAWPTFDPGPTSGQRSPASLIRPGPQTPCPGTRGRLCHSGPCGWPGLCQPRRSCQHQGQCRHLWPRAAVWPRSRHQEPGASAHHGDSHLRPGSMADPSASGPAGH